MAFVRLVPVFPFNLLNYALGLTRLSVRTFAVTSFVTMVPGALAYAYLGSTSNFTTLESNKSVGLLSSRPAPAMQSFPSTTLHCLTETGLQPAQATPIYRQ